MSTGKRKKVAVQSKTAQLKKQYPGNRPIPPSKAVVIGTIVVAAIVCIILVIVFSERKAALEPTAPQQTGLHYVDLETSMGTISLELNGDKAPKTVTTFLEKVAAGAYDGLTFHRVMKGFMIQGGDPSGDGTGGTSVAFENTGLSHVRGVISMASSQAGVGQSDMQFFIMHGDGTHLDGLYAAFGRVTAGMDVVDRIATVEVGENPQNPKELSSPITPITITKATEVTH
jgi:peptidyl-prolyl cis-trans isomerase B (cyclophilin B)